MGASKAMVALKPVDNVIPTSDITYDAEGAIMRPDLVAGAAAWDMDGDGNKVSLSFTCACGCGRVHTLPTFQSNKYQGEWMWNKNSLLPTFVQKITTPIGCMWAGYLTAGILAPD